MAEIETSSDISELAKALPAAQKAIARITKDATNPHFESQYSSLYEVGDAVLGALNEAGFSVLQPATNAPGPPPAVQVTTWLIHTSGQWIRSTYATPVARNDPQGHGSALTYARRQALAAFLVVIAKGEDDDAESAEGRGRSSRPPISPPKEPAKSDLETRIRRLETTLRDVKTPTDLNRAWDLAKGLRAELEAAQPKTAARLTALRDRRAKELEPGGSNAAP